MGTARPVCQALPCRCHLQELQQSQTCPGPLELPVGLLKVSPALHQGLCAARVCTGSWGSPSPLSCAKGCGRTHLSLSELSHILPQVLEHTGGHGTRAWGSLGWEAGHSRSVGSEHHGVLKGPLHLSWSLGLEGEWLWWGTHREQCLGMLLAADVTAGPFWCSVPQGSGGDKASPWPATPPLIWLLEVPLECRTQDALGGAGTPLGPHTTF